MTLAWIYRLVVALIQLIGRSVDRFRKPEVLGFHTFVFIRGKGIGYVGRFNTKLDAMEAGDDVISEEAMKINDVIFAERWYVESTRKMNRRERAAYKAAQKESN